jgi:hypothetical protein
MKSLILTGIVFNALVYLGIVATALSLLVRIKLKLNAETKWLLFANLTALFLRLVFEIYQCAHDDFTLTTFKAYVLFAIDLIVFTFYLTNMTRIITIRLLASQVNDFGSQKEIISQHNRRIKMIVAVFVLLTLVVTMCDGWISRHDEGWFVSAVLVVFTLFFSAFEMALTIWLSHMVCQSKSDLSPVLHGIVWLVGASSVALIVIKNSSWSNLGGWTLQRTATGIFLGTTYLTVLLIMFLLHKANKKAIDLAM